MEKDKKIIDLFRDDYALALSSPKWISRGGELLRYIGQNVVLVKFKKNSESDPWTTTTEMVNIIGISGFEEMTGTYTIAWKGEKDEEAQSERLTPEGFSFNVPEKDLWMHRFLPLSLHMEITEATISYGRFKNLLENSPSMTLEKIQGFCKGKQKETLGYKNYVSLIVDTSVEGGLDVGITECRLKSFSNPQNSGKYYTVGARDFKDNMYFFKIPKENFTEAFKLSINGTFIGMAKIIDLQG